MPAPPPNDIAAERACLGACMLEGEAAGLALAKLKPAHFYRKGHVYIFEAIREIVREGGLPDQLLVAQKLGERLEVVGGADYLNELCESVPSAANVERYAEVVKGKAAGRYLIQVGVLLQQEAQENAGEALANSLTRLDKIVAAQEQEGPQIVSDIMPSVLEEIEERQKNPSKVWGIATGLKAFDYMTGGLHPGLLYVIAARSGQGKSALLTTWFNHLAETVPALLFSLEMPRGDITKRLISMRSGVSFPDLSAGTFPKHKWDAILKSADKVDKLQLHIDDTGGINLWEVIAKAKLLHAQKQVRVVALDYLQIMLPPAGDNREREIAKMSAGMKRLARTLGVSVILLSQLRKPKLGDEGKRPDLADLKASSAIEADADVVLILHRKPEGGGRARETEFVVAKQRNGPCGLEKIWFEAERMQFMDAKPVTGQARLGDV